MAEGKSGWVAKFFWIMVILFLVAALVIVLWKLFAPAVFQSVFGAKYVEFEKRQKELEANQTRLQERVDDLEQQVDPSKKKSWNWLPWVIIIVLVALAIGIVIFVKNWRSGFDGKDKDQMRKYCKEYVTEYHYLDIKSDWIDMMRPIAGDKSSWVAWQGNYEAYTPGVDMPSHKCFVVLTNNVDFNYIWEEHPNLTKLEAEVLLAKRHFGRKDAGMPHNRPVKEEPFEGFRQAEGEAAIRQIKERIDDRQEE